MNNKEKKMFLNIREISKSYGKFKVRMGGLE